MRKTENSDLAKKVLSIMESSFLLRRYLNEWIKQASHGFICVREENCDVNFSTFDIFKTPLFSLIGLICSAQAYLIDKTFTDE